MDQLLNEKDVAKRYGVSERAVQGWRADNVGPQHVVVGKNSIRYREEDLLAYEKARTTGGEVPERAKRTMSRALGALTAMTNWKMAQSSLDVINSVCDELRPMVIDEKGGA